MILLFLLTLASFGVVSVWSTPTYMWFLNAERGADEIQQNNPPDFPENSALTFDTGPFGGNGRSVQFTGIGFEYIQSSLTETVEFERFSLCMFFYASTFPATLFEYKANSLEDNSVNTFSLKIETEGQVVVEMLFSNRVSITFETMLFAIYKNVWTFMCLIRDDVVDQIQLLVNDDIIATASTSEISEIKDFLPGYVQFGNSLMGRMSCVTYYDKPMTADDKSEVVNDCQLTGTTTTTPSVTSTHVWPLNNSTFGFELKNAQPPTLPANSACMRIGESYSSLPYGSIYLDGGVTSFLETTLPPIVLQHDVTIAFFLKPFSPLTGTLLHFLYNKTEGGIRELKLTADNGRFTLTLAHSEELETCGILIDSEAVSENVWYYIAFHRIEKSITLRAINLDTLSAIDVTNTDVCDVAELDSDEVGYLRIGDAFGGGDTFRGLFTCLTIFNGEIEDGEETLSKQCLTPDVSAIPPFEFNNCPEKQPVKDNYLRKFQDVLPIATETPVTSHVVPSVRECAWTCLTETNCRSMSVQKLSPVTYLCQTYDFVTSGIGLVQQSDTNYYVILL